MKRLPASVARRIRGRATFSPKGHIRWADVWSGVSAITSAGIFLIAVYAAFFSPFSQAVEGQLRSEVAETSYQKNQLAIQVEKLATEVSARRQQLEQQAQELDQQKLELKATERAKDAATRSLGNLLKEASELRSGLREQYRNKYLASLPASWLSTPVPSFFANLLDGALKGTKPSVSEIGVAIYSSSVQALTIEGTSDLERDVSRELREAVVKNCGDQGEFARRFSAQVGDVDKQDEWDRVRLASDAAHFFRKICLV